MIKLKELDEQQIKEQYDVHLSGNRNDRIQGHYNEQRASANLAMTEI